MSFFQRNRDEVIKRGYDPARLPPGQYLTDRFPVLHAGSVPSAHLASWNLKVSGLVENPFTLTWPEFQALPRASAVCDIHCVTKWSKFDTRWDGVSFATIVERARPLPQATYVLQHAENGFTVNTPLADLLRPNAMLADTFDGKPLAPEHGYPLRGVVPHLYFWKGAKWVRGLEFLAQDQPGFWERNGYHMYGDPFKEQRYWGD
jgi:DMSO/TMAO reductase YedYZ molybdopterin-dependent catalytic subunit